MCEEEVCPRCGGSGDLTWNPSKSTPPDPQMEQFQTCHICNGWGAIPANDLPAVEDVLSDGLDVLDNDLAKLADVSDVINIIGGTTVRHLREAWLRGFDEMSNETRAASER